MKSLNIKRNLLLFLLSFSILTDTISADPSMAKRPISDYFQECPWIGLVLDEINYGPLTISHVNIHKGHKVAFVSPGETLNGSLKYKVDSSALKVLHLYHLVIGINQEGAQDCIVHLLGMWNAKGHGYFTLKAPEKPGVYEVRFLFTEASTCEDARDAWNSGCHVPTSEATIGILVVE